MKKIISISIGIILTTSTCKTIEDGSELNSTLAVESTDKNSLDSRNFDELFATSCETYLKDSSKHCGSEIVKLACETKINRPDRAIYLLLGTTNMDYLFKNEILRSLAAKYIDNKLYAAIQQCDSSEQPESIDEDLSFRNWFIANLVKDMQSFDENKNEFIGKFMQQNCLVATQILNQHFLNRAAEDPRCQESDNQKRTMINDLESLKKTCDNTASDQVASLISMDQEDQLELFAAIFNKGYEFACTQTGNESTCDFVHFAAQLSASKLEESAPGRGQCGNPFANVKSPYSGVRGEARKKSAIKAKWLVRECCFCQISYYQKNYQLERPNPLSDHLLGVVNYLANLPRVNEPDSCQNAVVAAQANEWTSSGYYDYTNVTDCKSTSVVGILCPFVAGEQAKREWRNGSPTSTMILSPTFDADRAPGFLSQGTIPHSSDDSTYYNH